MTDEPDRANQRLTILEMEYALVAARLNSIDATLTIVNQRIGGLEIRMDALEKRVDERADSTDRKLDAIIRHLGMDDH